MARRPPSTTRPRNGKKTEIAYRFVRDDYSSPYADLPYGGRHHPGRSIVTRPGDVAVDEQGIFVSPELEVIAFMVHYRPDHRLLEVEYDEADELWRHPTCAERRVRRCRVVREHSRDEIAAHTHVQHSDGECLTTVVTRNGWHRDSPLHGKAHWLAVAETGVELAERTGADPDVVFAFGLIHDTRRVNDGHDPEHGLRAGLFAIQLDEAGILGLDRDQRDVLCFALAYHADGLCSTDATVGTCWDADRLHLPRIGASVDPAYLSTAAARTPEVLAAAALRRTEPIDWAA